LDVLPITQSTVSKQCRQLLLLTEVNTNRNIVFARFWNYILRHYQIQITYLVMNKIIPKYLHTYQKTTYHIITYLFNQHSQWNNVSFSHNKLCHRQMDRWHYDNSRWKTCR